MVFKFLKGDRRNGQLSLLSVGTALLLALTGCDSTSTQQQLSQQSIQNGSGSTATLASTGDRLLQPEGDAVRVGILVIDSAVSVQERYSPLMNYLSEVTGKPFTIVPLSQDVQFASVATGKLDFILSNPIAAVQSQRLYDTQFLATLSNPQTGSYMSGLIITQRDSNIQNLSDLRGKQVACVDFETAAAGCMFQSHQLLEQGIDPFTDFESFIEIPSQDNIVLAVLNGTIDAGFIRTGLLEKMVQEGLLNDLNEIRILAPQRDGFEFVHTTLLYPEWSFAATRNADPQLVNQVAKALLDLPQGHPALAAAKLDGFVEPVDYSTVDRLIEAMRLPSWDVQ
jgi:ABC-type phosphate/phosphonate transport system substrate-binding protein